MVFSTLYKKAVIKGKILQWTIEVEGNKFRTTSGYIDGQLFTGEWTVCTPKNEGKKNSTTSEQQSIVEAKALHKKKIELGFFENVSDINNITYFKPMLAEKYQDYQNEIKFPIASQRKLDGIRCIIRQDGMWTRNGKPIISAPHIFESLKHLFEVDIDLVLDGELYCGKDIEVDFNKIISCVRKTKPSATDLIESKDYIKYWIYDIPSFDKKYSDRLHFLRNKLILPDTCVMVQTDLLNSKQQINEHYATYISEGFEGQILRNLDALYFNKRTKFLLKNKEFITEEFKILEVIEGIGKLSNKAGAMRFEKGKLSFTSAINGTHEYLEKLWENENKLLGKLATIKYFELTEDGVPRFPKIIEIDRWDI